MWTFSHILDTCVTVAAVGLTAYAAAKVIDHAIDHFSAPRLPESPPAPEPPRQINRPWWLQISGVTPERLLAYAGN